MKHVVSARVPRSRIQRPPLMDSLPNRPSQSRRIRHLERFWSGEGMERIRKNAKKIVSPGAALYSRYGAVCVLRAVYRIHVECRRKLPYYGMMFPMRFPGIRRRTINGNFLVSPSLIVMPDRITDRRAVAEDVDRQLGAYSARESYKASWALMWLTAELRAWQYRLVTLALAGRVPFATGYSFWGPLDPPMKEFLGARVTNLLGYGVVSIPPGWNPVFSRFEDKMNLTLAWPDGAFPEDLVRRYADLIEEELLDP
jgi:hypothetical protein